MPRSLGDIWILPFLPLSFSCVSLYIFVLTSDFFLDEMAPKNALAMLHRKVLKRSHRDSDSNSLESTGSSEPKFSSSLESSAPEVQPSKKQKRKKVAKQKEVIQVGTDISLTSLDMSEINVMEKSFPYLQFMDKELMTPAFLERLWGNSDDILKKLQ